MNRLALIYAIVAVPGLAQHSADFDRDVRPVFDQFCRGCHNESNRSSGLDLTNRRGLLTGGNRGPAIIPGNPSESLLIQAVRHQAS